MSGESLILDTNVLVLFVVGTASRAYISRHKRLTAFAEADYDALLALVQGASSIIVTPNTLTETSNLAGYIAEPAKSHIYQVFRTLAESAQETYIPSSSAVNRVEFVRLGLTDAVILESVKEATLLTTDLDLYLAALEAGASAVNFNHLRDRYL